MKLLFELYASDVEASFSFSTPTINTQNRLVIEPDTTTTISSAILLGSHRVARSSSSSI